MLDSNGSDSFRRSAFAGGKEGDATKDATADAVTAGGQHPRKDGVFFSPAVIAQAQMDMRIFPEQTFDPLAPFGGGKRFGLGQGSQDSAADDPNVKDVYSAGLEQ